MKRILLRVLFIVLAALSALMAIDNPAILILTALSIFAAVKVDFFLTRNQGRADLSGLRALQTM